MAPEPAHQRTQEQSIKARKHQLFDSEERVDSGPRQPFRDCLRRTPAAPLSTPVKAGLWVVGVVVILLLAAAFIASGTRKARPGPTATSPRPVARRVV